MLAKQGGTHGASAKGWLFRGIPELEMFYEVTLAVAFSPGWRILVLVSQHT